MTPYYEHGGMTIYHGDCRMFPAIKADLLVTDPPYGIGEARKNHLSRGKPFGSKGSQTRQQKAYGTDYGYGSWDNAPPAQWLFGWLRDVTRYQIIWGGNYFELPPSSGWLVWDKDNGRSDFADCELAWTNLDGAVRRIVYRWNGMLQQTMGHAKETRWHPTQKPVPVMQWAIQRAPPDCGTIFDPFMGVGTTLVAAKNLGRRAIGIELEERYCEIAATRLSQEVFVLERPVPIPAPPTPVRQWPVLAS